MKESWRCYRLTKENLKALLVNHQAYHRGTQTQKLFLTGILRSATLYKTAVLKVFLQDLRAQPPDETNHKFKTFQNV